MAHTETDPDPRELLRQIHHLLRTPLHAVMGICSSLLQQETNDERRALMSTALKASQASVDLLSHIMHEAHSGQTTSPDQVLDVSELLEDIARILRGAHGPGASFAVVCPSVPRRLMGDAHGITMAVLCALQGLPHHFIGRVSLEATLHDEQLELRLRGDNVSPNSASAHASAGAADRGMTALMQTLSAATEILRLEEGGLQVVVRVPVRRLCDAFDTIRPPRRLTPPPLTALVVDDVAINRLVVERLLVSQGVAVTTASNGREAVDQASTQDFDLIVMDCNMPVMDGFEATRHILAAAGECHPVIVALTANATRTQQRACHEAGMHDFLAKPSRFEDLQNLIDRWFVLAPSTTRS